MISYSSDECNVTRAGDGYALQRVFSLSMAIMLAYTRVVGLVVELTAFDNNSAESKLHIAAMCSTNATGEIGLRFRHGDLRECPGRVKMKL